MFYKQILYSLFIILLIPIVYATDITVCNSGCNETTIADAITAANNSGDTIIISADTYTESITIDKDLTITGISAGDTIIQANASENLASDRVVTVNSSKTVTISNVTIRHGNKSGNGGGVLNNGDLTLKNCFISDNQADGGNGGGIFSSGNLTVINCTISGNEAKKGGGIQNAGSGGYVKLSNCTIYDNESTGGDTGGVRINNDTATIKNTIIAGNTGGNDCDDGSSTPATLGGTFTSGGYNLIGSSCPDDGSTDIITVDVTTDIDSFDTTNNVYPILNTSINALNGVGDCTDIDSDTVSTDQRGFIRGDGICDIGAYEYPASDFEAEIDVQLDSTSITDGTTTEIDIGTFLNGSTSTKEFTIENVDSTYDLKVDGFTSSSSKFTISSSPSSIAASSTDPFEITVDTSADGTFSGTISFYTNDDSEATFDFPITTTISATLPEIEVQDDDSNVLTDNNSSIDFGDITTGDADVSKTFTIYNTGTSNLTVSSISVTTDTGSAFTIDDSSFTSPIVSSSNDTFIITLTTGTTGDYTETITIANDDSDENPFTFTITGTILETTPEIEVLDGSTDVADGSTLDFGSIVINNTTTKTLTVNNLGAGNLTLSNLSVSSTPFSVGSFGSTTLSSSASTTFDISLDTSTIGSYSETLSFDNNDSDENPFNLTLTAEVTELTYTVTVNKTGTGSGTVSGGGSYQEGTSVTLTATPNSDSKFTGWSSGCSSSFTITGDKTCTATFTKKDTTPTTPPPPPLPPTMKLFVELAGTGTGIFELSPRPKEKVCPDDESEECHYTYNTATRVTITAISDKSSTFEYWSGNSSCRKGSKTSTGGEVDIYLISSLTCNINFKLKPQKLMLNYEGDGNGTVTVSPDRGTETNCSQDKCIIFDGTKDITLTPEPDQYSQFDEWTGHDDCIDDGEIVQLELISNKLCNAHFSLLPIYQVTVNKTGNGTGTILQEPTGKNCVDNTCEYAEGNEITLTAQPDAISSTFAGWNDSCEAGNLTITSDTTCTATFLQKPTYQISLTTNGDGKVTLTPPPPIDGKYFEGQTVTLVPELGVNTKGVAFVGDCDSDKIVMDSNKSCLVKFTEQETSPVDPLKPYTLHLIIDGANGTILVNTVSEQTVCNGYCTNIYAENSLIGLTIQSNPNARFTGWSKECIGGQIIMDKTKACTATFEPIYTLTIAKQGTGNGTITSDSGINCGEHCQTVQQTGDLVNLTVTPDPDSTFTGWNSNCLNGQVTINSSKICTATFTAKPAYKLTVAIEGIGKGKIESSPIGIDCGTTCEANFLKEEIPTVVQLIPYASPGSIFKSWDCDEETGSGIKQVVMDDNKHCTAVFDSHGIIQFAETTLEVSEEANSILLPVNRLDGVRGEVSVSYKTTDAGAKNGDYTAQQGTLTWLAEQNNTQFITIPILADKLAEPDEIFVITLLEPTGNAVLGTPYQLEITIKDVPWQSYVQFAIPEYEVNESEGMVRLIATRAGSSKWPIEVAIRTENGTATEDDYQMPENVLTWNSGDMEAKYVDINITQDALEGTEEYFLVAIDKIADKTEGLELDPDKIVAVVTIFDTPPTGSLEFDRNSYDVRETETNIEVQVNRVGGVNGDISVQYATQAGTYLDAAKVSQDFTATAGTLNWADGETTAKTILVPILLDNVKENSELFAISLSQPTGGAALGVQHTTIIEIADMTGASPGSGDDEVNYPGILQFSQADYTVMEGDGEAIITVERVGGQYGEVKVQYATQDDITDIVDIIYESTSGELVWSDGDSEVKYFTINLFDNDFIGTDHIMQVKLFNATGGTIIERNETIVNIQDDDKAVFVLSADAYANYEGKEAIIGIYRQGNNLISKVSLDYEAKSDTAIIGEDYTVITNTLVWESGDATKKEVKIPLIFDRLEEGNETFYFNLTKASNSATIGLPNTATITIVETDPADCKPVPTSSKKQSVNCYLQNQPEVVISDLLVEEYGTVDGGILQGNIQNSGLIQNVTLAAGTIIAGGSISGNIIGTPDNKPILTRVKIEAGTKLSNVVISSDAVFDPSVIASGLGIGVLFEDNSLIPNGIRLEPILGYMPIAPIFERQVAILTTDVLYNGNRNGILGIMNALAESNADKIKLGKMKQHDEYGYLYSYFGETRYAILPMRVEHILRTQVNDLISPELIIDSDNKFTFITHLGRKVMAQPVIQAPDFLNEELLALGLEPAIMLENGNIQVNTSNNYFYQARASLTSIVTNNFLGLHTDKLPVSLVFADSDLQRQQFIYPAAADTEALYALPDTKLTAEGMLTIQIDDQVYTGLLDYLVTKGKSNKLSIQDVGDINGDNCSDYQLHYPNGNSQIIFCTL